MNDGSSSPINHLAEMLKSSSQSARPAVDGWDPPYCGDIGLAIAADATWSYRGSPIRRQPLVKLFAGVLRRDADRRHYLVTPAEKVDVAVADAPFLAVEMAVEGTGQGRREGQRLTFRTNVDDVVTAGPEHPIRFAVDPITGGLKPYLLVRGRLEALVTRALVMDLVALATPDAAGRLHLESCGVSFALPPTAE